MSSWRIVVLIIFLGMLTGCARTVDVSERQADWQRTLDQKLAVAQTPDQLRDWLKREGVVSVDYNRQGELLAILEVVPGHGAEFHQHSVMMVAKVTSPESVGPFRLFVVNLRR